MKYFYLKNRGKKINAGTPICIIQVRAHSELGTGANGGGHPASGQQLEWNPVWLVNGWCWQMAIQLASNPATQGSGELVLLVRNMQNWADSIACATVHAAQADEFKENKLYTIYILIVYLQTYMPYIGLHVYKAVYANYEIG